MDIVTLSETHLIDSAFNDINNLYEIPNMIVNMIRDIKWERRPEKGQCQGKKWKFKIESEASLKK